MITLILAAVLAASPGPQGVLYFWDEHCVFACYVDARDQLIMPCHATPFPRWMGGPELCSPPELPDHKLRVRGPGLRDR